MQHTSKENMYLDIVTHALDQVRDLLPKETVVSRLQLGQTILAILPFDRVHMQLPPVHHRLICRSSAQLQRMQQYRSDLLPQ